MQRVNSNLAESCCTAGNVAKPPVFDDRIHHGVLGQITIVMVPFPRSAPSDGPDQPADTLPHWGKMPTTLARRLTSLFQSLQGVGGMDFQPVRRQELQMGQHLRLNLIHRAAAGSAGRS